MGSSSYITNLAGEITQHMEYLPFGETLIEEHLNSNNSPYKFNAKELDAETGNYYYGVRYYDPKFSIWLSVDPLSEMFSGISPYTYVLNNPIRYIDPTGMAAENNDCGIGCAIRKVVNKIFHPNRSQLPDGRIERTGTKGGTSRATGWNHPGSSKSKTEDKNTSESRTSQEALANNLSQMGVNPQSFIPQVAVQLPSLSLNSKNSIRINEEEIGVIGPRSVSFNFSTIGGTARRSTGRPSGGPNYILPLSNSQKDNLQAIAYYLITHPQATIRFQYPSPLKGYDPNFNEDLRAVYQMNFSQITNFLIQKGVTDPNKRVLMNYGAGFDSIVNP